MPEPNPAVLEFLQKRRSRPAKTLTGPYPDRAALTPLLEAAVRVPDHGKLEPWRLIALGPEALSSMASAVLARAQETGRTEEEAGKAAGSYATSGCAVAVIASPKSSEKIPEIEQLYSAGCVCLSLVNAALASGWGAKWLSGWPSHDLDFIRPALSLADTELVAGIIHIGTETNAPPERPRPDLGQITEWRP